MSVLRRLNNRIERWLDRSSLHEPRVHAQDWPGGGVPCIASAALERAVTYAHTLDPDACLKQLAAPEGVQPDGAARRWQFRFELPTARAVLACDWFLDGDARAGRFGRERFEARATPFPPPGSELATGVAEGRLPYAGLSRAWREERRRTPDLPLVFRDSDAAIVELQQRGLVLGAAPFTLGAASDSGSALRWVARSGNAEFRSPFR
jgi:hypothetical protein